MVQYDLTYHKSLTTDVGTASDSMLRSDGI